MILMPMLDSSSLHWQVQLNELQRKLRVQKPSWFAQYQRCSCWYHCPLKFFLVFSINMKIFWKLTWTAGLKTHPHPKKTMIKVPNISAKHSISNWGQSCLVGKPKNNCKSHLLMLKVDEILARNFQRQFGIFVLSDRLYSKDQIGISPLMFKLLIDTSLRT